MFSFLKNILSGNEKDTANLPKSKEQSVLPVTNTDKPASDKNNGKAKKTTKQQKTTGVAKHVTELSLHPLWERELDDMQKYSMSFMANQLEPLEEGNIAISGFNMVPHEDGIEIAAFVRNASDKPVLLGKMTLLIMFEGDQLFTRQEFDLSELGEIPAFHARPWNFVFTREHFITTNVLLQNWSLSFELAQKKMVLPKNLELEESWVKSLTDDQKKYFIELAKRLPELKEGEVNVQSVQAKQNDEGMIRAILLIRNGSTQNLSFEQLPLSLYDATGDKVAEGVFQLKDFVVNAQTSKPWMFIFPKESILKENVDLSQWKVQLAQN
ncbi:MULTISPECIES: accessory Sec system S-layer assembly protein [Brevibacillus]|uniref:accessory Sec system S-layer assembly protein n=1 Tax=Brevibacillus TaxID=55080 RepID=UPI000B9B69A0|nr:MULTISPECIES: accessory Sec system S-layer assembly protein [Brevibacillus]MCG7315692.1 accessory Sec system S-layer assembly protein [Brevibacillus laterosporus]MED1789597.1 accessory Sec system S-layer assembly protein [Brevibacillus laterosporus]RFB36057.1 accessory Sec system S-layer assembly protein [Brevibacillus sp. VP]